jgi:hypothetical protein
LSLFCACSRHVFEERVFPFYRSYPLIATSHIAALLFVPVVLLRVVADVQAKTLGVEVNLVVTLLKDLCDRLGVVKLTQVDVGSALLDGVTNQLGGAGFTLGSDNHGLLLLPGLVDDEGSTLCVLLSDLFGLDGGGEFR